LPGLPPPGILRADDGDAIRRSAYVTQDERQDSLTDAAEADDDDPALKIHMHFVFGHNFLTLFDFPTVI
jgi:hypothetical protein